MRHLGAVIWLHCLFGLTASLAKRSHLTPRTSPEESRPTLANASHTEMMSKKRRAGCLAKPGFKEPRQLKGNWYFCYDNQGDSISFSRNVYLSNVIPRLRYNVYPGTQQHRYVTKIFTRVELGIPICTYTLEEDQTSSQHNVRCISYMALVLVNLSRNFHCRCQPCGVDAICRTYSSSSTR